MIDSVITFLHYTLDTVTLLGHEIKSFPYPHNYNGLIRVIWKNNENVINLKVHTESKDLLNNKVSLKEGNIMII